MRIVQACFQPGAEIEAVDRMDLNVGDDHANGMIFYQIKGLLSTFCSENQVIFAKSFHEGLQHIPIAINYQ